MSAHQYRIVFRGQVLPGRREEEVRSRLMRRLRLNVEQATQVFCGEKVYLKRRLSAERTKTYVKELLFIGLQVRIEREDSPETSEQIQATPSRASRAAAADFDLARTAMFTPTQLDNVLAGFAGDYDSSQQTTPASHVIETAGSFIKPPNSKVDVKVNGKSGVPQRHVLKTVHAPHVRSSHPTSHKLVRKTSHGPLSRSPAPPTIIAEPKRRSSKHASGNKKRKVMSLADEMAAQQQVASRKAKGSRLRSVILWLVVIGVVVGAAAFGWRMLNK